MTFLRALLILSPAALLLAQTPPPKPKSAQPPMPTVTMGIDNGGVPVPAVPPEKVVLTVGETKITAAQFDQMIDSLNEQYRTLARGSGRRKFAENLVRILALADEGKRRKLDETPTFKTQSAFAISSVLAGAMYDELNKSTKLDEADVRKYYEAHKGEFEEVHARHILIRMQGAPVPVKPGQKDLTDAEALAKAQEIRKKIQGGADFAALAAEFSDDTGSGKNGGDLGTFHHNQMVPSFEQTAFALKAGELSEPVKTQFGYHLIKVESHDTKSFETVRADLERRMRPEMAQKAADELQNKANAVYDPEFFPAPSK